MRWSEWCRALSLCVRARRSIEVPFRKTFTVRSAFAPSLFSDEGMAM